jgi:hypothetical protein
MIQGGDPTGTGRGGTSIYGGKLCVLHVNGLYPCLRVSSEDELNSELRFTGAGILAMANSGPNSNGPPLLPYRVMLTVLMDCSQARSSSSLSHQRRTLTANTPSSVV